MKVSKYDSMLDKSGAIYLRETGTFSIDGRRVSDAEVLEHFDGIDFSIDDFECLSA